MYGATTLQKSVLLAFTACLLLISCRKKQEPAPVINQQVVSSNWMATEINNHSLWIKEQDATGKELVRCEFSVPGITDKLLENSAVLVYGKFYGYNQSIWPDEKVGLLSIDIYHSELGGSMDKWISKVEPGKVTVTMENTSGRIADDVNSDVQFRLIVIPKSAVVVTGYKPMGNNPLGKYSEGELRELTYDELCAQAGLVK